MMAAPRQPLPCVGSKAGASHTRREPGWRQAQREGPTPPPQSRGQQGISSLELGSSPTSPGSPGPLLTQHFCRRGEAAASCVKGASEWGWVSCAETAEGESRGRIAGGREDRGLLGASRGSHGRRGTRQRTESHVLELPGNSRAENQGSS